MAKFTIEVDTDHVESVLQVWLMLGRLLAFWRDALKKPIPQTPEEIQDPVDNQSNT